MRINRSKPPIDIRKKKVKGLFGTKWVRTSKHEQRKMKNELIKIYPDRIFLDDLHDRNSVDNLDWIEEYELLDVIFED